MMEKYGEERLKALKSKAMVMKPSVQLGKKGMSEESIKEIIKQLKKKGIVKVKFLKSALELKDKKSIAREIADKTGSRLVGQVGFTAVYSRAPSEQKLFK